MEDGGSVEEGYPLAFIIYKEILKDWIPARHKDTSGIFIFIPSFKDNPIREVTEEVAKQVGWLKSFYNAILIKKRSQMQDLYKEGHACEKESPAEDENDKFQHEISFQNDKNAETKIDLQTSELSSFQEDDHVALQVEAIWL